VIKGIPAFVKGFGENKTDSKRYHYALIKGSIVKEDVYYEIQYFPPWDKIEMWPIPLTNNEEIKKGKHNKPNEKYYEQYLVSMVEKKFHVITDPITNENFQTYLGDLKEHKLLIVKFLEHKPKNVKSREKFDEVKDPRYLVLFENGSKQWIKRDSLPSQTYVVMLEHDYWKPVKRLTKRKKKQNRKTQRILF
jgi:hypothetical protein